jgi:glycerol uptake facilitator protein
MTRRPIVGELCAEFAGTLILILFGVGVVAQVVTGEGTLGDHDSIAWGWGLGVVFGVYAAARISGAHLNPAVTLAMAVFRDFPWRKVLPFSVAQLLGAFVAALIVRVTYGEAIANVDPGHTIATQGIFSTLPGNGALPISQGVALLDQIVGTAILLFLVMALTDARNHGPWTRLAPVVIGLVVVGIGMAWGANAGYAINPARDLGPRLASFITGYDTAFRDQTGLLYFWVPIVGPLIGALLGAGAYRWLIERFLPDVDPDADDQEPTDTPAESPTRASAPAL